MRRERERERERYNTLVGSSFRVPRAVAVGIKRSSLSSVNSFHLKLRYSVCAGACACALCKTSEDIINISISMGWLWAVACYLHTLAGPVVMLLYPLYASVKAIESKSKEDDQQWLTYWILYSSIAFLEVVVAPVFAWIPMWGSIKLVCGIWLVLPPFKGAHRLYDQVIKRHVLKQGCSFKSSLSESQRKFFDLLSPQARESLEHYVEEHGTHALDNVIAAANKETYKNPFA